MFPSMLTKRQDVPNRFSGSVETFALRTGSVPTWRKTEAHNFIRFAVAPKMVRSAHFIFVY